MRGGYSMLGLVLRDLAAKPGRARAKRSGNVNPGQAGFCMAAY